MKFVQEFYIPTMSSWFYKSQHYNNREEEEDKKKRDSLTVFQ